MLIAHGNRPHRAQPRQHRPLALLRKAHLQRPAGEVGDDPRLLHVVDPARGAQVLPVLVAFQPHLDRGRPLLDAGGGDADRHRVPAVAVDRHRQQGGLPVGGLQESAAEQLGLVVDQAPRAALRLGDRAERRAVVRDQSVGRLRDRKVSDEGHGLSCEGNREPDAEPAVPAPPGRPKMCRRLERRFWRYGASVERPSLFGTGSMMWLSARNSLSARRASNSCRPARSSAAR